MSRPDQIPVCRLSHGLSRTQPTLWRAAQDGKYGPITYDKRGRQQVELEAVEAAEGCIFTDAQLARMLGTPSDNVVHRREKQERLRQLVPPPMQVMIPEHVLYSAADVRGLICGFLARRDANWISRVAALVNSRTPKFQI